MDVHERFEAVSSRWDAVVDEMRATAELHRSNGYETVEIHPGDVTVVGPDDAGRTGFDVLAPDGEFEHLHGLTATHEFDTYEVLRGTTETMVFALVRLESDHAVVFVPLYYERPTLSTLQECVAAEGALATTVRPLRNDRAVTFSHAEPEPFFPAAASESGV
jgi:hypothetical protein